jgi:hypothetical protein
MSVSARFRQCVNVCSPAFSQTVYVAGVHVHCVHQRLFSPFRGVRDWGHGFLVHRVDKFGRRSEAREGTMRGGQKQDLVQSCLHGGGGGGVGTGSREVC